MVWSMSYRPKPDSYPRAEIVEGEDTFMLEDTTPDGGTGVTKVRGGGQESSGRRVRADSIPTVIRWMSKRPLLDYETVWVKTVSPRFRALIEAIEPGVHQFEPVKFVAKGGDLLADRWFWQVCNRLDTVKRGMSGWTLERVHWSWPAGNDGMPIFDLEKVGDAKFWHDKHYSGGIFVSDEAKAEIDSAKISSVHFTNRKQV